MMENNNANSQQTTTMVFCDDCGSGPVAFTEGCFICLTCGYSKCG